MFKKIITGLICFAFLLPLGIPFRSQKVQATNTNLSVEGKSAFLMDAESGQVMFAKNENEKLPIASMTKIMTLLLTFEELDAGRLNENDEITVSENASGMGGSQVFLDANTNYKLADLIKSVVVSSANDASVALAERISGSEEAFVQKMNARARELGLENTNFVNCTGLPAEGAYSCAKDVAIMFQQLLSHEKYFSYSNIYLDTLTHPSGRETQLSNTNKLVKFYEGCDAGKTGSTSEAKFCLCATAKRAGVRVIACVIGCENSKIRNAQVSNMFNYAFNNFKTSKLISAENFSSLNVKKGKKNSVVVGPEENFSILSSISTKDDIKITQSVQENLTAPIAKGQKVGEISVYKNGELIKQINIVAKEDVKSQSYLDGLKSIFSAWNF